MIKRKTQYKRKPRLKAAFKRHMQEHQAYIERSMTWQKVLEHPSTDTMAAIADLLARLGFEPDGHGIPRGDWPPATRTNPLVLLDALKESVGKRPADWGDRQDTLAWKADVLEAATLVWAGAIRLDDAQIQEHNPRATYSDVWYLLTFSDLGAFWRGRGRGKSKSDICAMHERGDSLTLCFADKLRRSKGST